MAGAVESYRTDQHVLTAYRTLADHRGQRHTIDITLDQHRREDTSLRVEAAVEHRRMPVKISLNLVRQDKAVAENAIAVPLAGLAFVKVMLTEVPLRSNLDTSSTVRTAVLQVLALRHHHQLVTPHLYMSEVLFSLSVLECQDTAFASVLQFLSDCVRNLYATD